MKEINMPGVSRRQLLKTTASLTAGVVALGKVAGTAEEERREPDATSAPDHDASTGEIFDRNRHHRWDTV